MLEILTITAPIYLLIGLGYATTRGGLFSRDDLRVLGKLVVNLALPALVFRALAQRPLAELLNVGYLGPYALGTLVMVAMGYGWSRRVMGLSATASAVRAMGMACPNSGFVGYPVLLLVVPSVAGLSLALNMLVENLLFIPLLLWLADRGLARAQGQHAVRGALRNLARNPLMWSIATGLLVAVWGRSLPHPVSQAVDMLALTSGGVSLMVIGGTLAGLPLQGRWRSALPVVVGKLVLHPLLVLLGLVVWEWWFTTSLDAPLRVAVVLLAAMPMMSIYPTLAQSYGEEESSAVALLMTTVASFVTLSGLMWLVL